MTTGMESIRQLNRTATGLLLAAGIALLAGGMVLGALMLSPVQAQPVPTGVNGGAELRVPPASSDVEVRVVARERSDGRFEVALQTRNADGSWTQRLLPDFRLLRANPQPNNWYHSSPITVTPPPATGFFARAPEGVPTADTASICWVTHGSHEDLFWGTAGGFAYFTAGRDLGVHNTILKYEPATAGQARAIRECVDEGAAVIATTLSDPAGLRSAIAYAKSNGVVVTTFNSGIDDALAAGSQFHIALDDHATGVQLGERLNAHVPNVSGDVLCVKHEADNVGLDDRCNGINDAYTGGAVRSLDVSATGLADPQGTRRAIVSELAAHDYAAVVVLNQELSDIVADLDDDLVKISFITDPAPLQHLYSGDIHYLANDFASVQGYASVTNAFFAQWLDWGLDLGTTPPVVLRIDPLILSQDSAPQVP